MVEGHRYLRRRGFPPFRPLPASPPARLAGLPLLSGLPIGYTVRRNLLMAFPYCIALCCSAGSRLLPAAPLPPPTPRQVTGALEHRSLASLSPRICNAHCSSCWAEVQAAALGPRPFVQPAAVGRPSRIANFHRSGSGEEAGVMAPPAAAAAAPAPLSTFAVATKLFPLYLTHVNQARRSYMNPLQMTQPGVRDRRSPGLAALCSRTVSAKSRSPPLALAPQGILVTMPFVVAVYMVRDWEAAASGGTPVSEQTVGKATGLLAAVFCFAQLLTSFAWGMVSDRIGRKVWCGGV